MNDQYYKAPAKYGPLPTVSKHMHYVTFLVFGHGENVISLRREILKEGVKE